jgi:transposase
MKKNTVAKFTKKDFDKMFPDEKACFDWLVNHRFPNGIDCPVCKKSTKHHKLSKRPVYECDYCGHQVSPLADTIFHKSSTPLKTWFDAIYEMSTTRTGYSAKALQRRTGVTYKTAWRMFAQIRKLLNENQPIFSGEVEADETYIGGKGKVTRGRGAKHKTPVIGIAQRQGKVIAEVSNNAKGSTLIPFVTGNVTKDTVLYTDEFPSYNRLGRMGFDHKRINHSAKVYVDGNLHVNSIEGFWSLVKRGISGVYHSVSPKYLQSYINEYSFRYNHRYDVVPMFLNVLYQIRRAS